MNAAKTATNGGMKSATTGATDTGTMLSATAYSVGAQAPTCTTRRV